MCRLLVVLPMDLIGNKSADVHYQPVFRRAPASSCAAISRSTSANRRNTPCAALQAGPCRRRFFVSIILVVNRHEVLY
jgi:hypothetical protein